MPPEKVKAAQRQDPAATQPLGSAIRSTQPSFPTDAAEELAAAGIRPPLGPGARRLLLLGGLALAAAGGAAGLYRLLQPAPVEPTPAVSVNLDEPFVEEQNPTVPPHQRPRRRRARPAPAANPSPAPAGKPVQGPKATVAASPGAPAAPVAPVAPVDKPAPTAAPAPVGAPPQGPGKAAADHPAPTAAPPPVGLPEELESEGAPLTEEELAEEAQARAYADGLRFVLRTHRAQVVTCYERASKELPKAQGGRVVIEFTVDSAGKARQVRATENSTGLPAVGRCLEQRIAEWQFPRPPGGQFPTSYPFVFSAGG